MYDKKKSNSTTNYSGNDKKERIPDEKYFCLISTDDLSQYKYDTESVIAILSRGNYAEFSHAVSIEGKYIKDTFNGFKNIGYIEDFNTDIVNKDEHNFSVVISGKYADAVKTLSSEGQLMIKPRIRFNREGIAITVIGFTIIAVK